MKPAPRLSLATRTARDTARAAWNRPADLRALADALRASLALAANPAQRFNLSNLADACATRAALLTR